MIYIVIVLHYVSDIIIFRSLTIEISWFRDERWAAI